MGVYEQIKKNRENKTNSGVLSAVMREKAASYLLPKLESLQSESQSVYDTYKTRFFDENEEYKNTYRSDTEDALNQYTAFKTKYDTESQEILSYLEKYGSQLDEKYVTDIKDWLTSSGENFGKIHSAYQYDYDTLSQYKNENEYKKAVAEQKKYEETRAGMLDFDIEKGKEDLGSWEKIKENVQAAERRLQLKWGNKAPDRDSVSDEEWRQYLEDKSWVDQYGSAQKVSDIVSKKTQYINRAKVVQDAKKLADQATSDANFEVYAQKGEEMGANSSYGGWMKGYAYDNYVAYLRNTPGELERLEELSRNQPGSAVLSMIEYKAAKHMSEDEFKIYNSYIGKGDKDGAQKYLESIEDVLNQKMGTQIAEEQKTTAQKILFGWEAGTDQFNSGILNLFNTQDDYIAPSAIQYASGQVRESLADSGFKVLGSSIGQIGYDITNTTANMMPSILTSIAVGTVSKTAGTIVGNTLMGASAAGNAYQEALNKGFDKDQSRAYSNLVGASESLLQYALGGIGALGGLSDDALKGVINNIDNAFGRVSLKLGANMTSEFTEEYLQEVLTPIFSNFALGTNDDVKLFSEEALYSGILGAISAGLLEGGSTISEDVSTSKTGKAVMDAGQTSNLVKFGKSLSADTVAYKIAGKVNEKTSAFTIGRLLHEAGADSLSQTNISDIVVALEKKGIAPADVQTIVKWIDKAVRGEKLTTKQQMALDLDSDIGYIVQDILVNQNSTVNQRMQGYRDIITKTNIANNIEQTLKARAKAMEKASKKQGKSAETNSGQEINSNEGNSKSIEDNAIERKFEASAEGKTINNSTGELVEIEEIASIENGKMTLKVKNNEGAVETVDSDNISFATDEENIIYSAILDMGVDAATANTIIGDYKQGGHELSTTRYALGIEEAYRYGLYSIPMKEMTTQGFSAELSDKSKETAYNLGKTRAKAIVAERQAKIKAMAKGGVKKKQGNLHFEGDKLKLDKIRRESLNAIEILSQVLGNEIYVYESYVKNGKRVYKDANGVEKHAPNGMYYQKDGSIWIDLNAGETGQGTMLYTLSHELTHFIKQWSPEKFKVLADFLTEQYGKKGASVDELVRKQMQKAENNGRTIDYETAFEEMVADSMTSMLTDGKVIRELYKKDKTLFDKIKSWIDSTLRKIASIYKDYEIETEEGRAVRDMKDSFVKMQSLFAEALSDASENFAKADVQAQKNTTDEGGVMYMARDDVLSWDIDWDNDNFSSLKSQLKSHIAEVNEMQPVTEVYYDKSKPYYEMLDDVLKTKFGYKIDRQDFGSILFDKTAIANARKYVKTDSEAAAIIASPYVLKRGKAISGHKNHKNEGYPSVTFAAPVVLNGVIGDVAVCVFYGDKNRIHAIRVLTPEGSTFDLVITKKTGSTNGKSFEKNEVTLPIDPVSNNSIRNPIENVKENAVKNSDRDNLGNTLTSEQADYFKDSVVRDEKGNLKVMYRGDSSEFTVFDRKKSKSANLYGRGFYFTDSDSHAGQYGKTRAFYLDIKAPLTPGQNNITKSQMLSFLKAIENNGEDFDLYNYGQNATAESVLKSIWGKGDFEMLQDVNATAIGDLVAAIELFNEINGTAYDGVILPTETVTFNSEQAKLTSNKKPTSDPDIRFSMRENVEETKDLVAVHNLTEEKLLKSLQLGGLPMPSIAIARAKEGHSGFGRISLVFKKDTIDPQNNRNNKVYSGDAWTPTYPQIDFKISRDVVHEAWDKVSDLLAGTDYEKAFGYLGLDTDNVSDYLNRNGGNIYEAYKNKPALKLAYLKDNGIELELPKKQVDLSSRFDNEVVKRFAEKYGEEKIRELNNADSTLVFEKYIPEVKELVEDYYNNLAGTKMEWQIGLHDIYDLIDGSLTYFRKGIQSKTEDSSATRKMIDEAVDEAGYEKWLNSLFKGVIEKEGIRNNQDMFTPSGNRRSFEALHYEHNLENVIKAMRNRGEKGIGFGGGNIFGAVTTEYGSIADIKDAANTRMQNISEDEYDAMRQDFTHRFFELASSLPIHKDSFTATDSAAEMLIEAVTKFKTKSGMANYLRTESKGWANYSEYVVDDLIQLVNEIRQMPVGYFEAKPQRAVGFNEVATAIIPDNSSAELKNKLTENGVKFVEYESGKEQSRLEALNSLEDVKFSDRDPDAIANYKKIVEQLSKENIKLIEDVNSLKELVKMQRTVTHGKILKPSSVETAAKNLMKYAGAKGEVSELVERLNKVYNHILNSEELSWDSISDEARDVVDWLQSHEYHKPVRDEYADEALSYLHGMRISLDDFQKREAVHRFGSYKEFHNSVMGNVIIAKDGVSLDSAWQELSDKYPMYFDSDAKANDMPALLAEAISDMKNSYIQDYEFDGEMAAQDLLTKVYDSYWNVSTLYTAADAKQKEINLLKSKHNRQMQEIRESHAEKEISLKKEYQDKLSKMRANYKESAEAKIEKLRANYQESRKKAVEGRQRTEMRHKIKRVVNELNQYLLNGTKDKHVMVELQQSVALALDAVNMDTVGAEAWLAELSEKIKRETDPIEFNNLLMTYNRVMQMGDKMKERLAALKTAYDAIKNSDDPDVANAYDDVIMATIDNVVKEVGDTPLRNMSQKQLESVYDMYTMILTRVRDANKSFKSAKNEDISTRGGKTVAEVEKVGGSHSKVAKAFKDIKKFAWNALKPVTAFDVIGSETLGEAFGNVRKGEDTWAVDVKDAKKFYGENVKKYNYDSWDFKKKHSFTSTSGINFDLTLEQIMALYAYSKREQAGEHLQYGGFVFDESIEITEKKHGIPIKYEVNTANAHNISKATLAEIINNLSAEQRAFVDTMQDYLSTTMGAKGNEVSMAMYGVKLFKEKHYFPLKSAKQFMFEQNQVAGEVRIKNAGFTKETMPHAKNPIILNNFTDVWANHVNDMSMYHAFTLALEDFNRIFNYKTNVSEDFGTQSVKSALQNAYEKQCVDYIKDLITDLNGGARVDSRAGILNKGIGMFKKASVFASASVVVQQPSSIARAWAYIDFKYFVTKSNIDKKKHKALWEEIKSYAPVAIIKEMGYFDTHMGMQTTEWIKSKEYDGFKNKVKGAITDSNYRDELLSKAPAYFDELAWCSIWQAVKHETDKTTNLKPGTEEFLKRCGERFTEIITNTQVYDSVLSRSGMMRSKDTGMKMATAFMAEPTTSLNMLVNGIVQGVRGDKAFTRKSVASVVSSMILNSILVSFVYAARDDDDDEAYLEKYVSTLTEQTIDSLVPFNLIPIVKDIWSIVQGYEVERSDMSVVGDVWNAFTSLSSETKTPYRKVEDFVGSICAFFGLPVKNIMRDARAAYNIVTAFADDNSPTAYGLGGAVVEGITGDEFTAKDKAYAAIKSGDTATVKKTVSDMVKEKVDSGKTEKEAKSAVRSSFTSTFKSQYVAAAKAGDYNEMNRIRKLLYATGLYGTLSELDATLKKWRTED